MNKWFKAILTAIFTVAAVLSITACSSGNTPYDRYDGEGYTVSIRYDANGGSFTTNTTVINDTYNPELLTADADGNVSLTLLDPADSQRGQGNYYEAKRSGYFLAGWYTERIAAVDADGNALDFDGNPVSESGKDAAYTYSGLWSFSEDSYKLAQKGDYTASQPVLTLYAAWIPEFSYEFYTSDGTLIDTYSFNPQKESEIALPAWDAATGAMKNNDFPTVSGMTFNAAYLDPECENEITGTAIAHTGVFNAEDTSFTGSVMSIYIDYIEGEWYRISTPDQLIRAANPSAHYFIEADLDFTGKSWPMSGNFSGSIIGNGHTFSNITARQGTMSDNAGLFGRITESATITDLTIENATYSIMKGSNNRSQESSFGLLAGAVQEGAVLTNVTVSGSLLISPGATFISGLYRIGLVCGSGYEYTGIDYSGITVAATDETSTRYEVNITEVSGNDVIASVDRKTSN